MSRIKEIYYRRKDWLTPQPSDILYLQQAYSFPVSLGFWRLETGGLVGLDEEKTKKERKAAVAETTIFLLFCVKKYPYIYETILNKTEVDYYEKNHYISGDGRYMLNIAIVQYIA